MSIVIKKKPVFDPKKKDVSQGFNRFNLHISKFPLEDQKTIKEILLRYLRENTSDGRRAKSISVDPSEHPQLPTMSLNGYYSSNREETDVEFQKRKQKYEKDVASYNNWLKKNKDKIKKSLEDKHKELEMIENDLEELDLVEQYTN